MSTGETPTLPAGEKLKLSSAKSVGFRPGPALRESIDALIAETGRSETDIIRDFITAYWPECEALNRSLARTATPADVRRLRAWITACTDAAELGQDPAQILRAATEHALETETTNPVAS